MVELIRNYYSQTHSCIVKSSDYLASGKTSHVHINIKYRSLTKVTVLNKIYLTGTASIVVKSESDCKAQRPKNRYSEKRKKSAGYKKKAQGCNKL